MRILRTTLTALIGFGVLTTISVSLAARAQQTSTPPKPVMTHDTPMAQHGMTPAPRTKAEKIANALSAAPSAVSANATILDWPKEGEQPPVLRAGTNGWTCLPDFPESDGNDPMCLDATWMKWLDAYLGHKPVSISSVGIAYMIAPGGGAASNTDPYAMKATPDNQWSHHAPHVMIAVPDLKSLDGLPTDAKNGGPWVMWKDTPYAHIMAPVANGMTEMKKMTGK
jgi:hypothetical protein